MNYNIDYLIKTAKDAGREILKIYNSGDFGIIEKDDLSPLTKADTLSHNLIKKRLMTEYPDIPIISEEGKDVPFEQKKWDYFWLVDPLDGTKEFIKRNGEFTVNIALIELNRPVFGVIYIPVKNTVYFGAEGSGAFKQIGEDRIKIKSGSKEKGKRTGISSRSHSSSSESEFYKKAGVQQILSAGSSLKFCYVAEGLAQFYYRHNPTMEWDTAAGHAIAESAGAKVYNLSYNKKNLRNSSFIVSGVNNEETVDLIKRELRTNG